MRELSEPLLALETVVQRMANQEPDVRAEERGPKEVRAVASALNDFADAQGRAQAVEGRIQSELRSLDTARDDFVSNVSHELRTPLTTISGYLELVAEEFEDRMEPRHERMLEATRRNVARLKALIDDLLALSRAEGRGSEMEPVDLALLVREAVTDVRITAARRGIHVTVAAPDRVVPVLADRAMLHRAFLNVLTNAVKFSHDRGDVAVVMTVRAREVEVSVTDHGIGIPAAELDRLGTRFFRASNAVTNEIAGTGLGLRIMQTIVDRHSGEVVIESREGEGTTVVVSLRLHGEGVPPPMPHEIVAEAEAEAAAARAVAQATTPALRAVADDPAEDGLPRIVPAFPRRR
jgi:signal transduction histidine kinase